ncbi:MAG: GNAT family N-acetyltransferase [Nanoarchaeota archaeon]|nr:GNAT family N-acetyltransferase [Nanoarchaeota archaeon]
MNIVIRKAIKSDIPLLNKLDIDMHNYLGSQIGVKFTASDESYTEADFKKQNVYVAVVDNRMVGFITFSKKLLFDEFYGGKYVFLDDFAVDNNYRGKGVGKKLYKIVLDYAKKNKANIKVDTLVTNKKTIKLYKKLGFKPLETNFVLDVNKKLKI